MFTERGPWGNIAGMTTKHIDKIQCKKLWQSVVLTAVMDALRPRPNNHSNISDWRRNQREGDQWIRDKRPEFRVVCGYAGLDPDFVSEQYVSGAITWEKIAAVKKSRTKLVNKL